MKKFLIGVGCTASFLVVTSFFVLDLKINGQVPSGGGGSAGSTTIQQLTQTVLAGTATTFTFSSIPAAYTDLILTVMGRCDIAALSQNVYIQFNGDTGANYDWQFTDGNNTTVTGQATVTSTQPVIGTVPGSTSPANVPTAFTIVIHNYTGTVFFKEFESHAAYLRTSAIVGGISLFNFGGGWNSTAAITSITIGLTAAGNFIIGSTATLWGQK